MFRYRIYLALAGLSFYAFSSPDPALLSINIENQLQSAHQFNKKAHTLFQRIFGVTHASPKYYLNHPLDFYSMIEQTAGSEDSSPLSSLQSLIIEVKQANNKKLASILIPHTSNSMPRSSQLPAVKQYYIAKPDLKEAPHPYIIYRENSTILSPLQPHTFEIKTNDSPLIRHTFPNHLHWIVFFHPYIIFMEPSQFYQKKNQKTALLSFIDLKYLQPILGQAHLPLFRLPISIDNNTKENLLRAPHSIYLTNQSITLYRNRLSYQLNRQYLDALSELHQISFNIIASMLNLKTDDITPFIRESKRKIQKWIRSKEKNLEPNQENILQLSKKMIIRQIVYRASLIENTPRQMDHQFQSFLHDSEKTKKNQTKGQNIVHIFQDNLEKNEKFQKVVFDTCKKMFAEK